MSTSENEVIEQHRLRMELRQKLEKLSSEYVLKMDMWDIAAEFAKIVHQASGFITQAAFDKAVRGKESSFNE